MRDAIIMSQGGENKTKQTNKETIAKEKNETQPSLDFEVASTSTEDISANHLRFTGLSDC